MPVAPCYSAAVWLKLWHSWQFGFMVALFVGLSGLVALLWATILLLPLMLLWDLLGWPEPGLTWVYLLAAALFPLAVGKLILGVDLEALAPPSLKGRFSTVRKL